jgi:ubiquinol-cytochrome c reductase iron-sulfur subunit
MAANTSIRPLNRDGDGCKTAFPPPRNGVSTVLRVWCPYCIQGHHMATVKKTTGTAKAPRKAPAKAAEAAEAPTLNGVPMDAATTTEGEGVDRRDFIHIAAVSFAGVGALAVVYPLVTQMSASADVLALASIEVDVAAIEPGQAIKTSWRKQPVFIRNLTPAEIAEANAVDVSTLREPQTLAERTQPGKENWLITLGVCTHLGCVPLGAAAGEIKGEYGGYFCPCHGSHYDTAARIRKGPAPLNLVVPEYAFLSDTVVKIG